MKPRSLFGIVVAATCAAANAQVQEPDQFYTNGESLNAWTPDAEQRLRSTLWFARNPIDSPSYRQMVAVVYDAQPDKVFYLDPDTKLCVGRLDLTTERFSMLPESARKERLPDIDESMFSAPGKLPSVAEMFDPLPDGLRGNRTRMLLPPPTAEFPRLQNSSWETSYMAANRSRVRAILDFQGDRGTYRLQDRGGMGRLFDVQYDEGNDGALIHGRWTLGNSNGYFRFSIPQDNVNVFWGEWGFESGRVIGAWDGIRKP